jgi:hypothetical protein
MQRFLNKIDHGSTHAVFSCGNTLTDILDKITKFDHLSPVLVDHPTRFNLNRVRWSGCTGED